MKFKTLKLQVNQNQSVDIKDKPICKTPADLKYEILSKTLAAPSTKKRIFTTPDMK